MALDGIALKALCRELKNQLCGGKLQKVYQPKKDELVFHIHSNKENYKLFITASSSNPRLHLIDESVENPAVPHVFCMLLRKHIQGGRIYDISQKEYERIVEISFENVDELGFSVNKKLVIELMGRHSNVSLVDMASNKILDSMKRISFDTSRVRQLLPGLEFTYPPAQDKKLLPKVLEDKAFFDNTDTVEKPDYAKIISSNIQGIGPLFAKSLAKNVNSSSELFDKLYKLLADIESNNIRPCVYLNEDKSAKDFYVIPMDDLEEQFENLSFNSISDAMVYYYEHHIQTQKMNQKSNALVADLNALSKKIHLKIERLEKDINEAKNSEHLRLYGELLTANLHLVKHGDSKVELLNYYTGENIEVPIDPKFSPNKNAQLYYKKYGKARTAIKEKSHQLEEAQNDLDYIESVLLFANQAVTEDAIADIKDELFEQGYIKKRPTFRIKTFKKPEPLTYTLASGSKVFVGKNNKENDYLTTKFAKNRDIWLHTKDIPGSHVILKVNEKEASEKDIFAAASIAAFHSKAQNSENVPVDYVAVKYVKKPSGAKAGMVIFTNNKTLYVSPKLP